MKDIIVVSLNPAIDRNYTVSEFIPGRLFRCENPVISPGGKGVNVARIISELGGNVTLTGFFAGNNGQFIVDSLIQSKVNVLPVYIQGETRNSINIIDNISCMETEILEKGPTVLQRDLKSLKSILSGIIEKSDSKKIIIFSGGIPEGVSDNIYYELISNSNSKGAICFLDSSAQALINGTDAKPFFVKPNLREFIQIVRHVESDREIQWIDRINYDNITNPANIRKIYEFSKELKINNLVITLSEKGALLVTEQKVLYMNPPQISPVNTIGSGDSFTAGFAYALASGFSMENCLKTAGACGASNALFEQVGVIDKEMVDKFIKNIEIEEKTVITDE